MLALSQRSRTDLNVSTIKTKIKKKRKTIPEKERRNRTVYSVKKISKVSIIYGKNDMVVITGRKKEKFTQKNLDLIYLESSSIPKQKISFIGVLSVDDLSVHLKYGLGYI